MSDSPSRSCFLGGCETCKERRKKCDENRPSCLRCLKAGRTCRGYENSGNLIFRPHLTNTNNQSQPQPKSVPTARKCSLPTREIDPKNGLLYQDGPPKEVTHEEMRKFALQAFFYDYCIPTSHSSLSGGFLSGLEPMVRNLGLDSPVADACRAAAFASHGIKLHRKFLIYQAEILHQNLLRHLALRIQTPAANSKENLTIAVLLGLYQMIISEENNPGHHTAHAAGVAAILQIDNNYSRVLQTVLTGHPLLLGSRQKIGIPSPRVEIGIDRWLLNILIKFSPMWKRMEAFFAGVPNAQDIFDLALDIKPELIILDRELEDWQKSQKEEFKPVTIDSGVPPSINPGAGYYPGRVDMYIDLYVATLWNISRIALCILKNLMARLPTMPSDDSYSEPDQQTAFHMAEDMIASLPYHLSEDLQIFLKDRHKHTKITNPGRPAGGLLIMHAIHAASRLEILPLDMREYFETCLTWMGKRMGIGQAAFLAEASGIDSKYLMDGWLLILLGLLV